MMIRVRSIEAECAPPCIRTFDLESPSDNPTPRNPSFETVAAPLGCRTSQVVLFVMPHHLIPMYDVAAAVGIGRYT